MQVTLLVTQVLHIGSGVFWAGSTFALARTGATSADLLFRPQMGAALVAIASGGYLWHLLHPSGFGTQEQVLGLGALCSILAAVAQAALCGPALRQLGGADDKNERLRTRVTLGQQLAGILLAVAVICMAAARYV